MATIRSPGPGDNPPAGPSGCAGLCQFSITSTAGLTLGIALSTVAPVPDSRPDAPKAAPDPESTAAAPNPDRAELPTANGSPTPAAVLANWQLIGASSATAGADAVQLRCWWARPAATPAKAAVLVLPEVFGVNGWVRGVAERLAAAGYAALAMPIFARTAPNFEADYDGAGLEEGRRHRDLVTAADLLADASLAIGWLQAQPGLASRPVGCVGFCFGGHLALIAATLAEVGATCAFYGARVSQFRPGGGEPTLALVPQIGGELLFFCGDQDPLMPPEELAAIEQALGASGPAGRQRRLIVAGGAGHGYMCEARGDYQAQAAEAGWQQMLELFEQLN